MKKFITRVLLICSPLIILYAYPMVRFANGESFGDLSQYGNYFFNKEYNSVVAHKPDFKRHVVLSENITKEVRDSDVLIIGDSFTQLGYNNFMEYLQSLLPTRTVYGIHTIRSNEEWHYIHQSVGDSGRLLEFPSKTDVILYLLRHADHLPSTIVIESSEMWPIKTHFHISEDSLPDYKGDPLPSSTEKYDRYNRKLVTPNPIECVLDGRAFEFAQKWLKRWKSRPVEISSLTQPLFTAKGNESTLYYLPFSISWTDEKVRSMRSDMTKIIDEGTKRNVNILFVIIPLKHHLYKDFMLTGAPQVTFISDYLTDLTDDPHYLICYPIFRNLLEQGEKDLFLCNDTHWSYKGAKICAEEIKQKIDSF